MKKIAILGITGSIGLSTVKVVKKHPEHFKIVLASSNNKYKKLFSLARELHIPNLVITNENLKQSITDYPEDIKLSFGENNLQEALSSIECDIVLNAISGSAGLRSSMTVISQGSNLALANKESLVMAGHLITENLKTSKSKLIPVDSEHSAILQAIGSATTDEVKSLILTASGGPFRNLPLSKFENITLEDTLKHPTWDMGPKITVDSATMMNKGLEVIEAHWLFDKPFPNIKTVIHPQSIIHSFVEFVDGSIVAQLSFPNMQIPILFALTYPEHINSTVSKTNVLDLPELTFSEVKKERYPLFFLACEVGKTGGLLPTLMNAANEAAVDLFINKKLSFNQIFEIVEHAILTAENITEPEIDEIISANNETFQKIKQDYKKII
ncbi:MAG: 1-deoxy-D-xylulose-5-phosphate reductoisomerase [Candidatus Cloacimonetes bacterium]|nr:1-deoxy-D-xylulose-5-phosphate reductoisomerase [Candidatus Cloacimonadota bacterium]